MKNWQLLIAFQDLYTAYLVKGYLDSNGVDTILGDEHISQLAPYYSSAVGGVKLLIHDADYSRGIQLLKDGGYLADEGQALDRKVEILPANKTTNREICPFCNSDNIAVKKVPGIFAAVLCAIFNLFFLIGAIFPWFQSANKCFDCGKEWKYKRG